MIKIKIDYESSYITNIKLTGHANYDEYGKDIVCASVSSIVITSLNAALSINDKALDVLGRFSWEASAKKLYDLLRNISA